MRAYKYTVTSLRKNDQVLQTQTRIYVPSQNIVFGYGINQENSLDFFSSHPDFIAEAALAIRERIAIADYRGEVEIIPSLLSEVVKAAKELEDTKERFKKVGRRLVHSLE